MKAYTHNIAKRKTITYTQQYIATIVGAQNNYH